MPMSGNERIAGFVLAIPMLLLAIWGFFVFTVFLHCTPLQWLMYNVCAPTEIAFFFTLLFSKDKPQRLCVVALPLLYFGTVGLFIFPWSGQGAIVSQISHLLMTLSVVYVIMINRKRELSRGIVYCLLGVALLIAIQQRYCYVTADVLSKLLSI